MKWVVDLNDSREQLAFIVNGDKLWAMCNDPVLKIRTIETQYSFQTLISQVKLECLGKFLTLFSFLFILMCFEFRVLYFFNMCCNFLFKFFFVGLWVQLFCLFSMCVVVCNFFFQLSLLVCNCSYGTDQRIGQPLPSVCFARGHGYCISTILATTQLWL
jgi:hypothetical protein